MKAPEHHQLSEGILPHPCSLPSLTLPTLCSVLKIVMLWGWNLLRVQLWALGTGHIFGTGHILGTALGSPALCVSAGLMTLLFNVIFKGLSLQLKQKLLNFQNQRE